MNDKSNEYVPFATRKDIILCAAFGCFYMTVVGMLSYFTSIHYSVLCIVCVSMFLATLAFVGIFKHKHREVAAVGGIHDLLEEGGSVVFRNSTSPIFAIDNDGVILWCNAATYEIIEKGTKPVGLTAKGVLGDGFKFDGENRERFEFNKCIYSVQSYEIGKEIILISLSDVTEATRAKDRFLNSRVCIAYIAIDNVEDILQYVHDKFRVAVSGVDEKLKSWAESMHAVIKSYENDKYVMFFDSKSLDECIKDRFSILDDIRDARVGDGVSVTVSMGVARLEGTLEECEIAARDAIDIALQRGGDQVVYNNNGVTEYYGGRTKSVYKRSNVRSRTFTNKLTALMSRADNVLIMGHRYGDFDSFGASVGVAKLAMLCGVKVNVAVDLRDKNLEPCIAMMQSCEGYSSVFVDNADGLDLVSPDTLLVLVDHNTPARAQFADIAKKVRDIVVIDHHRRVDSADDSAEIAYIEPSASSACELVTEMLESVVSSQTIFKEEADMLLAGILLDTKQFTRNTGTRTFGCAQYLRGAGASPTDVYSLFKTAPDDLKKEARFHTAITIYRSHIAIASCEGDTDESYRVIASKAADKMLTLQGIEAAFALVRIGEQIHISGRSSGNVNVQLILEKLHGGGHFDVAGAQVVSESVFDVLDTLKSSIDDYLADN